MPVTTHMTSYVVQFVASIILFRVLIIRCDIFALVVLFEYSIQTEIRWPRTDATFERKQGIRAIAKFVAIKRMKTIFLRARLAKIYMWILQVWREKMMRFPSLFTESHLLPPPGNPKVRHRTILVDDWSSRTKAVVSSNERPKVSTFSRIPTILQSLAKQRSTRTERKAYQGASSNPKTLLLFRIAKRFGTVEKGSV